MTSPDDPQQLAKEIERTRARLGETVEALAAKADVKARTQDKARQLTTRLQVKAGQASRQIRRQPVPLAVAGAAAAIVLALLLIKQSKRR